MGQNVKSIMNTELTKIKPTKRVLYYKIEGVMNVDESLNGDFSDAIDYIDCALGELESDGQGFVTAAYEVQENIDVAAQVLHNRRRELGEVLIEDLLNR